jgi:hypothetical protein
MRALRQRGIVISLSCEKHMCEAWKGGADGGHPAVVERGSGDEHGSFANLQTGTNRLGPNAEKSGQNTLRFFSVPKAAM